MLRNKGLPITPEEEDMRAMLESIQEQLMRSEQFHGKLSQLWAQLQLIKESGRKYGKLDEVHGWNGVRGDNMNSITKVSNSLCAVYKKNMPVIYAKKKKDPRRATERDTTYHGYPRTRSQNRRYNDTPLPSPQLIKLDTKK